MGSDRTLLGPLLKQAPGFPYSTEKMKFNRNLLVFSEMKHVDGIPPVRPTDL